jgi:hypothetical protein
VSLARFGALGALLGLVPMLAAAQGFPAGVVAGTVAARSDTGAVMPASGAVVSIIGSSLNATTDSAGRFVIGGVPVGPQAIRVTLAGYRVVNRGVRVPEGDTVRVAVTLQSDAPVLSPVRTVAKGSDAEAFASKPNVGTIAMGAAAMAGVPSVGEPDVVRVAQLLPGVVGRLHIEHTRKTPAIAGREGG